MSNQEITVKSMKIGQWGHQGDVIFTKVKGIPKMSTPRKDTILALGSATGHSHRVTGKNAKVYETAEGIKYLRLTKPSTVTHEEHANVTLPIGYYRIDIQREYDLVEGVRKVMD